MLLLSGSLSVQIVSGLSVLASWYRGLNLQPFDRLGSLVYMEQGRY